MDALILTTLLGCWLALIVPAVVAPLLPTTRADSDVRVLPPRSRADGDGGGTRVA